VTNYNKISKKSSHIAFFHRLYIDNFPDFERRDWANELELLENEPRFHVTLATCDEQPVGFITYWAFDSFSYIEHLAVDHSQRGKGYGSGLVRQVASLGRPLLLEVEPPIDDETRRRIAFYQHLGLALQDDIRYVQPPYSPGKPHVPLCLMTSSGMSRESINAAVITLRGEVYRCG